jgi:hypothetical protein
MTEYVISREWLDSLDYSMLRINILVAGMEYTVSIKIMDIGPIFSKYKSIPSCAFEYFFCYVYYPYKNLIKSSIVRKVDAFCNVQIENYIKENNL